MEGVARWSQRGAVVAMAAIAACATVPPCPERGGPVWRELTSEHFVLRSDLPLDEATDVLRTLEETRAAMLASVWRGEAGPLGRTQAIALSSPREFAAFTGPLIGGMHLQHPPFRPTLVLGAADATQSAAKHEVAHELAFSVLPVEPPWYAEGLAGFLQTIRYDRAQGDAYVGEPAEDLYRYFSTGGPMDLDRLLGRVPDDPFQAVQFYATSWLLVHYLFNKRFDGWQRLTDRLARLEPGRAAFLAEFPDLSGDGLYRTLIDYARGGQYTVLRPRVAPWTATPRVRTMADTEAHGARAYLYWALRDRNDEITDATLRTEIDEGLHGPAPSVDALAVAFYGPDAHVKQRRAELAALATRTHPESWMSWLMAADGESNGLLAKRGDLFRGLAKAPDEPEILLRLATVDAQEGQWDDAVALTNRILGAGLVHHGLWLLHAQALRETGHCAMADRWAASLSAYLPLAEVPANAVQEERPCQEGADHRPSDAGTTATAAPASEPVR